MNKKKYSSKHHPHFAFEREDVINLDAFSEGRLLHWIGMKSNSLEIRRLIAEYFRRKYPENIFWISILEKDGLL
jgi:hypothetical protein